MKAIPGVQRDCENTQGCGLCGATSETAPCKRNRFYWTSPVQSLHRQVKDNKTKFEWAIQDISIQRGYIIFSKISSFQRNIMRHAKKQEGLTHAQEKQQAVESSLGDPEVELNRKICQSN